MVRHPPNISVVSLPLSLAQTHTHTLPRHTTPHTDTNRHSLTPPPNNPPTQAHKHSHTHGQRGTLTHTPTHPHAEAHTDTSIQTHSQADTFPYRHTHTYTHTHPAIGRQLELIMGGEDIIKLRTVYASELLFCIGECA